MKIDHTNTKVVFEFSPKDYFLVHDQGMEGAYDWSLNTRIDRSYKGKDDDIGLPVLYLSDEEAKMCIDAGFIVDETRFLNDKTCDKI